MTDTEKLITEYKNEILELAEEIRKNPELGFNEFHTSKAVGKAWEKIGLICEGPFAMTGLTARIKGKGKGPVLALIGELDAVGSPNNKYASSEGIAHACGHFIQVCQVFAAGCALVNQREELCGDVVLMAVPAEEFIEIEKRSQMRKDQKVSYLSGKPEFLKLGVFDGIDMAAMIHAQPCTEDYKLFLEGGNLGFTAKNIRFIGKAAHGAQPFDGRNALECASLFLTGVNANRSTFRDDESIRIHPIITKGGSVVNSVPDDVRIETYVRGSSQKAIEKGCAVVDRCVKAAALMMNCSYEIETIPGYLPLNQDHNMSECMKEVAVKVLGKDMVGYNVPSVGSTDMGDISQIIPAIQPTMGGFKGELHSAEFDVEDVWKSCLLGGRLLAGLAVDLLGNNAQKANKVITEYKALLSKEEYFEYMNKR